MNQKVDEQRSSKRALLQVRIQFELKNIQIQGYMTNLSEGGCLIYFHTTAPLQINEKLKLSFALPTNKEPIFVMGRVVWCRPFLRSEGDINCSAGIQFTELKENYRKKVFQFIQKYLTDTRQA